MKKRVSATIDEETLEVIERILKKRKYRNKSHVIEEAIQLLDKKEEK